ncbi:MAG: branched-chain amino acid ABC transporter permease [Actinomycetota bacterium]|jgi:branched-chain amino acid transport system permease protein|nr:branched-chain amino acid ABC transporter permease [Actinomycetota bacterium]
MSLSDIVGILVTTVILGSIYGLVAIGMTLIYGTLRILDMSQGSMVMVGSFIGWGILVVAGWNPIIAIVLAFIATFGLGTLTQLVSVQPLMKRMNSIDFEMVTFITTFAVAMILSNVALEVLGPQQRNVTPVISGGINVYHGVNLPYQSLTMAIVSVVMMGGLGIFLARTRWGMAIRAVAQDLDAARLMGVPVSKLYPLTMGLASALAGVAGVFLGGLYFAYPSAGDLPLLEALIVVIFGGLGSLPGTVYAAYAIGLIQAIAEVIVGETWSLPILYGVILLVLIFRPYGLLGKPSEARL